MTIVEMLVAIFIFTIGIAGFTLLFSRTWRVNKYTLEMGQSSIAVSQGVKQIVNYVRGARQGDDGSYPLKSAANNDLVLYSDYDKDNVTERLHFYKSGQDILMGVTNPTTIMPKSYPVSDQQILTIAKYIVNDASTPIFYFYDKDYYGGATQNPLATPATVSDVRIIKIYLHINIDPYRTPDNIEMESLVKIRNINDYDRLK